MRTIKFTFTSQERLCCSCPSDIRPTITLSLPIHSIHKLRQWKRLLWYEASESLVSVTLPHRLRWSVISLHFLPGFIAEFKGEFQRPLFVKYSGKADSPLQSIEKKLDNKIRTKQRLTLTQSGLWVEPEPMRSYIFMWCSIFLEGSSLNIEIHKESKRPRVFRSKRALQDDLLCQANIKFDDLWNHLASEAQRESNCELSFVSIISRLLRDLSKLAGGIHESNFRITVLDRRQGMHFITVDVESLLKLHRRPTAIYAL